MENGYVPTGLLVELQELIPSGQPAIKTVFSRACMNEIATVVCARVLLETGVHFQPTDPTIHHQIAQSLNWIISTDVPFCLKTTPTNCVAQLKVLAADYVSDRIINLVRARQAEATLGRTSGEMAHEPEMYSMINGGMQITEQPRERRALQSMGRRKKADANQKYAAAADSTGGESANIFVPPQAFVWQSEEKE